VSDKEQELQQLRRMLENHMATPAPEFVTADQRLVAAAALACQAELGMTPASQEVAADVLFTAYPEAIATARAMVAPETLVT
jgi:hypothetical protein